jgi:hypothetical protein
MSLNLITSYFPAIVNVMSLAYEIELLFDAVFILNIIVFPAANVQPDEPGAKDNQALLLPVDEAAPPHSLPLPSNQENATGPFVESVVRASRAGVAVNDLNVGGNT